MVLKLQFRVLPTRVTAAMFTTAIRVTMRQCSIAIAPDGSWTKRECKLLMLLRALMKIDQIVKHGRFKPVRTVRLNYTTITKYCPRENLIEQYRCELLFKQ